MIEAIYRLPFDAERYPVRITQGRNGPWSHSKDDGLRDGSNAVDFGLPDGSEVRAARAGKVIHVINGSDKYYVGTDPEIGRNYLPGTTNMVVIRHEDGTSAFYSHLAKNGVRVERGQPVKAGEPIAETGRSGWVGPYSHLHFEVVSAVYPFPSLPVTFRDYEGPLEHTEIYLPYPSKERK